MPDRHQESMKVSLLTKCCSLGKSRAGLWSWFDNASGSQGKETGLRFWWWLKSRSTVTLLQFCMYFRQNPHDETSPQSQRRKYSGFLISWADVKQKEKREECVFKGSVVKHQKWVRLFITSTIVTCYYLLDFLFPIMVRTFPFFTNFTILYLNFELTPSLEKVVTTWELFKDLGPLASKVHLSVFIASLFVCMFSLFLLWLHSRLHFQGPGFSIPSVLSVIIIDFKFFLQLRHKKSKSTQKVCKPLRLAQR